MASQLKFGPATDKLSKLKDLSPSQRRKLAIKLDKIGGGITKGEFLKIAKRICSNKDFLEVKKLAEHEAKRKRVFRLYDVLREEGEQAGKQSRVSISESEGQPQVSIHKRPAEGIDDLEKSGRRSYSKARLPYQKNFPLK